MSILTIAPWPTVKQGNAFVITGKLIDAVTLQPLPGMHVAFNAVFIPRTLFGAKPMNNPSQITDPAGNFKATVTAPNEEGIKPSHHSVALRAFILQFHFHQESVSANRHLFDISIAS
jgi:hypothetical protein